MRRLSSANEGSRPRWQACCLVSHYCSRWQINNNKKKGVNAPAECLQEGGNVISTKSHSPSLTSPCLFPARLPPCVYSDIRATRGSTRSSLHQWCSLALGHLLLPLPGSFTLCQGHQWARSGRCECVCGGHTAANPLPTPPSLRTTIHGTCSCQPKARPPGVSPIASVTPSANKFPWPAGFYEPLQIGNPSRRGVLISIHLFSRQEPLGKGRSCLPAVQQWDKSRDGAWERGCCSPEP